MSRQPGTHRPDRQRLIPLWRNEHLPGTRITLPGALRAVLATVLLMAAVMAVGLWRVVDLSDSNSQLIHQVKDTQESYHASRLEFEAKIKAANAYTQAQVKALACSVVAFTPPARSNAFVRSLAATYHCPPYRPPATSPAVYPDPAPASAAPGSTITVTAGPLSSPLLGSSAPPPTGAGAPPRSPTPSATPAARSSVVCLIGLVCLP